NTASELAVGFESMQNTLTQLVDAPGNVGQRARQALGVVKTLVLDASHSTKIWSLVHPTTLADEESRALEKRLAAAIQNGCEEATRDSVTEAIAILYATVSRKDRHLILSAISKFAETLPSRAENESAIAASPRDTSQAPPAAVIARINELNNWQQIASLATVTGSLYKESGVKEQAFADLKRIVGEATVSTTSSWALLFTRISWAINECAARGKSVAILPLLTDVAHHWYTCLSDRSVDQPLSASARRLYLPAATALTWQQAVQLDCSIDQHEATARESRDLLSSLARFKPASRSASAELAVLVGLVSHVVASVAPESASSFETSTEQLLNALRSGEVCTGGTPSEQVVSQWCTGLLSTAEPVADAVSPVAKAMAKALKSMTLESAYMAWVE
ncbi:hypothetical protein GGI12_006040, partial [Dipsacomyces acuminosporus]